MKTDDAANRLQFLLKAQRPLTLASLPDGFLPAALADMARASKGRCLFIASDEMQMRMLADTVHFFAPELEIIEFPAWDCLPYDRASPSLPVTSQRMAALHALQNKNGRKQLVLTTANAVLQRTLSPFRLRQVGTRLAVGERIVRERLIGVLQSSGYDRVDTVADSGEFAVRGSVIDLYPAGEEYALRLDFFDDEIESMRYFDTADQRSVSRAETFDLLPATESLLTEDSIKLFRSRYREMFGATATGDPLYQAVSEGRRLAGMDHWLPLLEEKLVHLFDHLSGDDLLIRAHGVDAAAQQRLEAISDYHANRVRAGSAQPGSYRPLSPNALYFSEDEWTNIIASGPIHAVTPFQQEANEEAGILDFGISSPRDFAPERSRQENIYSALSDHLKTLAKAGRSRIIASYSLGARSRLIGLLKDHGVTGMAEAASWQEALGIAAKGTLALIVLPLDHGFTAPDLALLTEQDVLGDRLVRRAKRKKSADAFLNELNTLEAGDLIVHEEHGIGRYTGLASVPVGKSPHDCVALEYAGGDKLYVPVENIDVLTRYGSSTEGVSLDKLGGEGWQRRKALLKERIRAIAGDLLRVAAARALRKGEAVDVEPQAYASFADRFPYDETEDQERVIAEVLADLSGGKPMDRLVCGDVGFGKTEVAMRAAFAAAMSGLQVAVIAPTTLLARQHYTNFAERFEGFPLQLGRLSRLVPAAETKRTKEGLESGQIDIVIGTHALLAKSLKFRKLGLVIVDEEQRFGVTHKEQLKALKTDVHVLTLTATPIPRTLQMAMSGLRELSVIQTPPVDRLAVRTYVMPFDPVVLREALLREHYRGGQSFIVVPRISDMPNMEEFLREQVPEISYIAAHGQMTPTEVEERMSAFYDKKYDVLLSTTIIESGIDISSANTMIIHRADRFGLAQLYQLRGRVGRSKTRAYAYLTHSDKFILSPNAEKRLKVLGDLDSLGAGFQIASHDLDIRGAGNLVGDEQSGHIKEVGFELYQSMLEDAIAEAKSGGGLASITVDKFSPQITVDAPIMIPEDYVPDLSLRMALYRRLNDAADKETVESFAAEMIDRFGPLPEPTENLLKLMEIKQLARLAGVEKIEVGPKGALVSFFKDRAPNVEGLIAYAQKLGDTARLRPDCKMVINRVWNNPAGRLNGAFQLARGLAKLAGHKV